MHFVAMFTLTLSSALCWQVSASRTALGKLNYLFFKLHFVFDSILQFFVVVLIVVSLLKRACPNSSVVVDYCADMIKIRR